MKTQERGSILIVTMILVSMVLSLVLLGLILVQSKTAEGAIHHARTQARLLAESGVDHMIQKLIEPVKKVCPGYAFPAELSAAIDGQAALKNFTLRQLENASSATIGEYESRINAVTLVGDEVFVDVESHGYWPTKAEVGTRTDAAHETILAKLKTGVSAAQVFDYAYFVNHWGWFYGNAITAVGSVRANGPFSFDSNPFVDPWPLYGGYDAGSGTLQKKLFDGGVFAGLAIDGSRHGLGGLAEYEHANMGPAKMPNISEISYYKQQINNSATKGTIRLIRDPNKVFGADPPPAVINVCADGIYGNDGGEKDNLYLDGTDDYIIEVNGMVVVQGALMIKGRVQGQGTIITKKNTYLAGSITYKNGRPAGNPTYSVDTSNGTPTTRTAFEEKPTNKTQGGMESYIANGSGGDFLGLFARKHIVLGDFRAGSWEDAVMPWLTHNLNRNDEDCGKDGIHGTGDCGEGDGVFQVSTYTAADDAKGFIPPGANIGDAIPGTGEDLDGNGEFGERFTTRAQWRDQFDLPDPFNAVKWGGSEIPATHLNGAFTGNYTTMDGVYYTNHAFAGNIAGTGKVSFFGSVVSRNEAMIFSPALEVIHDERLAGGAIWRHMMESGTGTPMIPGTIEGFTIVEWRLLSAQ